MVARRIHLNESVISTLKCRRGRRYTDYHDASPDGFSKLILRVWNTGAKTWMIRPTINGKRTWRSIGKWPEIGLVRARQEAMRRLASLEGWDRPFKNPSFRVVAEEWFEQHEKDWSARTRERHRYWLTQLIDAFGDDSLEHFAPPQVLRFLRPYSYEQAKRMLGDLRAICAHAVSCGYISHSPILSMRVGTFKRKPKTENRPAATSPHDLGEVMWKIMHYRGQPHVRGALLMMAYTLARPGEVRHMRWREVDMVRGEWRYRMPKTGREHLAFLSPSAIQLLKEMRSTKGVDRDRFVFSKDGTKPISVNTPNSALRRMGIDTRRAHYAHGFRAAGRTLLAEDGWPFEVLELALGHTIQGVPSAYARAQHLDARRAMMKRWAEMLHTFASEYAKEQGNPFDPPHDR